MEYDERHLYHKYVLDDSFYNLNQKDTSVQTL